MDLHSLGMADTDLPLLAFAARLVVAALLGGVIGFEREFSLHAAGLRTHMLVALAAALYTLLVLEIFHLPDVLANGRSDPIHSVEAVTAGIAFLGAGVIFRGDRHSHGLTTAAGLWLAGAVGMAAALGYYLVAGLVTLFAVIVLVLLRPVESVVARRGRHEPSRSDADP